MARHTHACGCPDAPGGAAAGAQEADVFAFKIGPRPGMIAGLLDDLARQSGWRDKAGFFLANVFPTPDYMRQRYGLQAGWLLSAEYPYRLLAGLADWFRMVSRRLGFT